MMDRDDRRPDDDGIEALFEALREVSAAGADAPIAWASVAIAARRRRLQRRILAGTAVTLALGAAFTLAWLRPRTMPVRPTPTEVAAQTPELRLFLPAPGIRVVAERDARISIVETDALRLVDGTVWVEVDGSRGPRPFRVETRAGAVRVVGTRFAVLMDGCRGITVAVDRGSVEITAPGRTLTLQAGQEWRTRDDAPHPITDAWTASFDRFLGGVPTPPAPVPTVPVDPDAGRSTRTTVPRDESPSTLATVAGDAALLPDPMPAGEHEPAAGRIPAGTAPQDDGGTRYREAERLLAEGRIEDAVVLLDTLGREEPGSRRSGAALMDIATASLRLGRTSDAAAAYRRYLDEQPLGDLRGEARIALCRLLPDREGERTACYLAYLEEFPGGSYADEARRFTRGVASP